jgi:hypothetical protein
MKPTTKETKPKPKARSQDKKQANKEQAKTESQEKQEEGPKEAGKGRTQTATTRQPTHYELGASVPSASAVAEASGHRPSVLGATG